MTNAFDHRFDISRRDGEGNRRATDFFDAGTFVEIGAHVRRTSDENEPEGIVAGYGSVDGRLVFAFFQDNSRMKGALDAAYAKKIEMIYQMALRNGAPIVSVLDSAGAILYDGVSSMAAYGAWMRASAKASGVIPQIAVIDGVCAGSAAIAAAMADFIVSVSDKVEIYMNPRAAAEEVPSRAADCIAVDVPTEAEAFVEVRKLLAYLPSNNAEGTVTEEIAFDTASYASWNREDVRASLRALADDGTFCELYPSIGGGVLTGLIHLSGTVCGVVAGNPLENEGALGTAEARKAAKLVSFCDAFGLPVLTLVDNVGVSGEDPAAFAALSQAYANATCPLVTAIVGNAYGAAFTMLGSRSLGSDLVYALTNSSIGLLSPEASVAFVWNDRVGVDGSRSELEQRWRETYGSPAEAAVRGEIDDVIAPGELRARLAAAVLMLLSKASGTPTRRHSVMPF